MTKINTVNIHIELNSMTTKSVGVRLVSIYDNDLQIKLREATLYFEVFYIKI